MSSTLKNFFSTLHSDVAQESDFVEFSSFLLGITSLNY